MPLLLHLDGVYSFAHIPSIQGGIDPSKYSTNENKMTLSGWMTTLSNLELGLLFEFNQTKKLPFNLESGGLYLKKNFLDDFTGDILGLDAGVLAQFVPTNRLKDPITPYNALANFSIFAEFYKNILFFQDDLCVTPFLGVDLGIANRGYPWLDPAIGARMEYLLFSFEAAFLGSFGFGPQNFVNIGNFNGYAFTRFQAIDLELVLMYQILDEGSIQIGYFDRLYARNFPQWRQGFFVELDLPIPLF
ncbi:MAG: hypothetical protein ACOYK9_02920 [Chlamydiia bacterium]